MNYGTQYLTQTEYNELGGDSSLSQNAFNLLEYESRKEIDLRTQNRIIGLTTIPNDVKICVSNLINMIKNVDKQNNKQNISSETVGKYTISYTSAKDIVDTNKKQINDIIKKDLYNTKINDIPVLYKGVN